MEQWDLLQTRLAAQVSLQPNQPFWAGETLILALDVQYDGDRAFVAGDLQTVAGEWKGTYIGQTLVDTPYLPSYFAFREGPVLQRFITHWRQVTGLDADVFLIDGHGIAHPRKLGVASWLGVMLQIPTIGCAKDSLLHYTGTLAHEKGSVLPIELAGEEVGVALRSQDGIKAIFVSAGHLTGLPASVDLVSRCCSLYRVPDNLRRADQYARQAFRQEPAKDWTDIGSF